jgi:hypothetical protein
LANLHLLSLVTKAIFYLKKGVQLIDFGAERFGIFRRHGTRYPLQSFESRPKRRDSKGFPLLSGLKEDIFLFLIPTIPKLVIPTEEESPQVAPQTK